MERDILEWIRVTPIFNNFNNSGIEISETIMIFVLLLFVVYISINNNIIAEWGRILTKHIENLFLNCLFWYHRTEHRVARSIAVQGP